MSDEQETPALEGPAAPAAEPAVAAPPVSGVDAPPVETGTEPPPPEASASGDASLAVGSTFRPERILDARPASALAALGGALVAMAFAGIELWFLAFIAWIPLILAVRGQTPRRAFRIGLLAGFVEVAIGFYWLTPMLQTFSGFPLPLCVLFASILTAYQGGRIALLTWTASRAAQKGWDPDLSFAAAFALSELIYPLLFPWYFGASFHDHPLFMQTAELGGPILVSVIFVGFNLALASMVRARLYGARVSKPTVALGFAVTLAAVVFGDVRMRSIDGLIARSQPVKVGLVQSNIDLHQRRAALPESMRLTKLARDQGAELVVWSEATIPQPFEAKSHANALKNLLGKRLGVPAVVGGVLYERLPGASPGGRLARYFNSAFTVDGQGEVTGRYDKQFLLMFGEYLPFGDIFPVLYEWSPNSGAFTPGKSFEPLKLGDHRLATMICYEDIIPGFVNQLVRTGDPDLLVNLTNDRWFQNQRAGEPGEHDTTEPIQHLALAKLRSIEHRMYLARVSNSGLSALVDANGRVVVQTKAMQAEAVVGEARYMRVPTLYSMVGDTPWWVLAVLTVAACVVERRRVLRT
ncbi:MAG: apolipoprotein N-acyltransferase [Deltaproteobacteria bacterium]|nr:apolipoprotein N-acyltransferase [Deltaproteobacteria bacterium]